MADMICHKVYELLMSILSIYTLIPTNFKNDKFTYEELSCFIVMCPANLVIKRSDAHLFSLCVNVVWLITALYSWENEENLNILGWNFWNWL
jgi:hypothetical protein